MRYRFSTCDVFTETRFGGNPLAVLPHAEGLSDTQMQQIAREFNFSETSFVFPPESGHTRRVRIFTPGREVPFAGHPNVGTAFILGLTGELGEIDSSLTVTFEENAGLVPVTIHGSEGRITSCEVAAPEPLSLGERVDPGMVAAAIGVDEGDVLLATHPPRVASVGLAFVFVEFASREAVERARVDLAGCEAILETGVRPSIYLYERTGGPELLHSRMFAPLSGVPEDPATGSAACAVAGLLAHLRPEADGTFRFQITQGVEMGRPSALQARADKRDGVVRATGVAGSCVFVSEGSIEVD